MGSAKTDSELIARILAENEKSLRSLTEAGLGYVERTELPGWPVEHFIATAEAGSSSPSASALFLLPKPDALFPRPKSAPVERADD